jgi:hypothetical protein
MNPELEKHFSKRERATLKKYNRLRRAMQRSKKELLWASTAKDHDQIGAEIEKKEANLSVAEMGKLFVESAEQFVKLNEIAKKADPDFKSYLKKREKNELV